MFILYSVQQSLNIKFYITDSPQLFQDCNLIFPVTQNITVRPISAFYGLVDAAKSPFQRWQLVCFHSNTFFLTTYNSLVYIVCIHTNFGRDLQRNKCYVILSKTTHFLSVFCEVGVVKQCTKAQAGVAQDRLIYIRVTQIILCITFIMYVATI